MRLIDVCDAPIRTVAVSPDGRFVAAFAEDDTFGVFQWGTGDVALRARESGPCDQIAFGPNSAWVVRGDGRRLRLDALNSSAVQAFAPSVGFAGGVIVTPDGKALLATQTGLTNKTKLDRWELPAFRPGLGFNDWSPFRRLAISPNGEYIAGIWENGFELRFAGTGGIDHRYLPYKSRPFSSAGFATFTHDSTTCAFGWDSEIHVLDLSTSTSKVVRQPAPETRGNPPLYATERQKDAETEYRTPYRDAAFTGSGRHFATIEQPDRWARWDTDEEGWYVTREANPTCLLKFRDVKTWAVVREYDWSCGPLTCLAFTADGTAGVCGTADGRLVQFDVDE
jgi:WD40 repeat protein